MHDFFVVISEYEEINVQPNYTAIVLLQIGQCHATREKLLLIGKKGPINFSYKKSTFKAIENQPGQLYLL